ncbi:MAG: DUF2339 domain-containing protein, partial [Paracoccaceae bacterium]
MPYIFLLGALVLAWPVATVYLLISHNALKRTVKTLQADIAKLGHTDTPDTPDTSATSGATSGAIWGATSGQTLPPRAARARPSANRHTPIGPAPSTQPTPLAKAAPTQAIVLTHANGQRLVSWVGANWVYVIAAISLALAGVFLVQYSVENGLLSPTARIVAALLFGAVLIVGGDLLRRRSGDTPQATTAYLPSVFSGAGLVTLFAAVIAARTLYALISPEVTFAGLVSVALGGLVLGWFYGPLLAAIGLIGAFGAPFVVGESSDTTPLLYGYFIILAALGLGIDTVRRWAWVTALTLVLGYICGWLIWMPSLEMGPALACYLVALVGLAITIPVRRLRPDHTGMMILPRLVLGMQASRPTDSAHTVSAPAFPVSVAFGAMLATTLGLVLLTQNDPQVFWVSTGVLAGLACLTTLASHRATALQDTAILPVGGFLAVIFGQTTQAIGLWPAIAAITPIPEHPTGTFFLQGSNPTLLAALGLLVMAAVMSTCALTRGLRPPIQEPSPQGLPAWFGVIWAAVAALTPPLTLIFLDLIWEPAPRIGPMSWALCALGVAALMVVYADRLARHDGPTQRLRMSLPVL